MITALSHKKLLVALIIGIGGGYALQLYSVFTRVVG
jgi:hypothetical protein